MKKRPYHSPTRARNAEARRRAVLDAARALFAERGIDAVTMAEIAASAEVGVSTVYAAFASKEGLLRALMHEALFGPAYRAALARLAGETDPVVVLARTAEVATAIYQGEDDALGLLRGASAFAPSLRAIEEEFEALRYAMQEDRVHALARAGLLAPGLGIEDARRILWALTSRELYRNLVKVAGWPPARFQAWLAQTLLHQLVSTPLSWSSPMPDSRVFAPTFAPGEKVKGPASYFSSIEKTYGRPMQEWLDLVVERLRAERHMEVVAWLKTTYRMGHGHANAIVAYVRAAGAEETAPTGASDG